MDSLTPRIGAEPFAPCSDSLEMKPPATKIARIDGPVQLSVPSAPAQTTPPRGPAYNGFILSSDRDLEALLAHYNEEGSVALIRSPEDLRKSNLVKGLKVTGPDKVITTPGRLFNGKKLILLLDFRHMSSEQTAELNGMFEQPPRYQGQTLDAAVELVSLVSPEMLRNIQMDTNLGSDFWRRISHPDCQWNKPQTPAQQPLLSQPLREQIPESDTLMNDGHGSDESVTVINFASHPDWQALLCGGPALNDAGAIIYQPGKLSQLPPDSRVVLKGAPWQDLSFLLFMRNLLADSLFEANGEILRLAESLRFVRADFTDEDVACLQSGLRINPEGGQPLDPLYLNSSLFNPIMCNYQISDDGTLTSADTFAQFLGEHQELYITTPLTHSQWLKLLYQVQQSRQKTGRPHTLWVGQPQNQPECFQPDTLPPEVFPSHSEVFQVHVSQDRFDTVRTNGEPAPLVIDIMPDTQLTSLSRQLQMTSVQQRVFARTYSDFRQALELGKPVILRGCECNPELLQSLETLFCAPPFLWLDGHKIELPKAKIQLLWPPNTPAPTPVWEPVIQQAETVARHKADATVQAVCKRLNIAENNQPAVSRALENVVQLHQGMASLPTGKHHPGHPPALNQATLTKIVVQAELESQLDQASDLMPCHWRKAVNSVLLKEYRASREAYCWLKVLSASLFRQTGNREYRCDQEKLAALLQDISPLNRQTFRKHFWPLASCFGPELFATPPLTFGQPPEAAVTMLTNELVARAGESHRNSLAVALEAQDSPQGLFKNYDRQREQSLIDAFAGCSTRAASTTLQEWVVSTAASINELMANPAIASEQRPLRITALLRSAITYRYGSENPLSEQDMETLSVDLAQGNYDRRRWLNRRLNRLTAKVKRHPLVFLKGDTGAGKSWLARAVAHQLNPEHPATVLTLGPTSDSQTLFGENVLIENQSQSDREAKNTPDQETRLNPGSLLQWARMRDSKPLVLILDEATLTTPGMLNSLSGLSARPPFITWQGHSIPLTEQHRVILTSNPEHYPGRWLHETIREQAVIGYYTPLPDDFLGECILSPALMELPCLKQNRPLLNDSRELILNLWQQYQKLLPEREFTPRDLLAVTQRIYDYLELSDPEETPSREQLNGIARQSFHDVIGNELPPEPGPEVIALEHWLDCRWPTAPELTGQADLAFEKDYLTMQIGHMNVKLSGRTYDFTNSKTHKLARALWWDLCAATGEKRSGIRHRGRHATLIEGPPGRGKDSLLDLMACHHTRQSRQTLPVHINAGLNNWTQVREAIETARRQGDIVIISELNLIESYYLEGLLNDLLDGEATLGFHLFATINPVSYSGRKPLSPALKNRMTCLCLEDYNREDLKHIGTQLWPNNPAMLSVVSWHCQLVRLLATENHSVVPTTSNLVQLLSRCREHHLDPEQVKAEFTRQYCLYLTAADTSIDELEQHDTSDIPSGHSDAHELQVLSHWLHHTLGPFLKAPVSVVLGAGSCYPNRNGQLQVSRDIPAEQRQNEVIRLLAEHHWKKTGLPVQAPDQQHGLLVALYKQWQKQWAQHYFGAATEQCQPLFRLTEAEQATLQLPINQPLIQQARAIMTESLLQPLPGQYTRLRQILTAPFQPDEEQAPECPVLQAGAAPSPVNNTLGEQKPLKKEPEPDVQKPEISDRQLKEPGRSSMNLDGLTKHKARTVCHQEIFNQVLPDQTRTSVGHLQWTEDQLQEREQLFGVRGLEVILPAQLEESVQLKARQHYGVYNFMLSATQWQPLPSSSPEERIVSAGSNPRVELEYRRDPATGIHWVRAANTVPDDIISVTLHYVVELLKPAPRDGQPEAFCCPSVVKMALDELFTRNTELKQTLDAHTPEQRVKKITEYCNQFTANEDIPSGTTGIELLVEIIQLRRGVCRHQAQCFYALASYFGIPVRIIHSNVGNHKWCEYALDGYSWHPTQLSYQANEKSTYIVRPPNEKKDCKAVTGLEDIAEELRRKNQKLESKLLNKLLTEGFDALSHGERLWVLSDLQSSSTDLLDVRTKILMQVIGDYPDFFPTLQYFSLIARCVSQEIPLSTVENFLHKINRSVVTHGEPSKKSWSYYLIRLLKNCQHWHKPPAFMHFYHYIVIQQGWLSPVQAYPFTIWASKLQPSAQTTRVMKNYIDELIKSTPARKGNREPLPSVPELSGRSTSLEQALKNPAIHKKYTFEPDGSLDIQQLLLRDPMFCREGTGHRGNRSVLLECSGEGYLHPTPVKLATACFRHIINNPLPPHCPETAPFRVLWQLLHEIRQLETVQESVQKPEVSRLLNTFRQTLSETSLDSNECGLLCIISELKNIGVINEAKKLFLNNLLRFKGKLPYTMKSVIYSAFAHYLYRETNAVYGKLQAVHPGDTEETLGVCKPESADELWTMLDSSLDAIPSSLLLKQKMAKMESLHINKDNVSIYLWEYIETVDIRKLSDFLLSGSLME